MERQDKQGPLQGRLDPEVSPEEEIRRILRTLTPAQLREALKCLRELDLQQEGRS